MMAGASAQPIRSKPCSSPSRASRPTAAMSQAMSSTPNRMSSASLYVQHEVERRSLAVLGILHRQQQGGPKDAVRGVPRLVREVELCGEHRLIRRLHLHVDVARAPRIQARYDSFERVPP